MTENNSLEELRKAEAAAREAFREALYRWREASEALEAKLSELHEFLG
jgi:hypothetical protein